MSGFRSRFPTVTPWTTDQDLPDIVFRACFATVSRVEASAGPPGPGGAPGPAALSVRRTPARAGRHGAGRAARGVLIVSVQVAGAGRRQSGPGPACSVSRGRPGRVPGRPAAPRGPSSRAGPRRARWVIGAAAAWPHPVPSVTLPRWHRAAGRPHIRRRPGARRGAGRRPVPAERVAATAVRRRCARGPAAADARRAGGGVWNR